MYRWLLFFQIVDDNNFDCVRVFKPNKDRAESLIKSVLKLSLLTKIRNNRIKQI